jgi:hypothetical protein
MKDEKEIARKENGKFKLVKENIVLERKLSLHNRMDKIEKVLNDVGVFSSDELFNIVCEGVNGEKFIDFANLLLKEFYESTVTLETFSRIGDFKFRVFDLLITKGSLLFKYTQFFFFSSIFS